MECPKGAPTLHRYAARCPHRGLQAAPIRQAQGSPQGLPYVRSHPPRGRFLPWGGPAAKKGPHASPLRGSLSASRLASRSDSTGTGQSAGTALCPVSSPEGALFALGRPGGKNTPCFTTRGCLSVNRRCRPRLFQPGRLRGHECVRLSPWPGRTRFHCAGGRPRWSFRPRRSGCERRPHASAKAE
ncbi:hypothetical protein DFR37_102185 [Eoetvoesiella caeni]|uniref:Uncharacterized protein n=1 Tax=Eoetvoesiella caeni TaxID=645616 RepID=A0A366HIR3_9BURK|nr:hypothetical protein DFR37_102185 [Eoetvoesiella caeni]